MDAFINKWLGKRVDYDKAFGYQCVDLIKQYLNEMYGLSPGVWGNAIDYWRYTNVAVLARFTKIQSSDVQKGDIVVFNGLPGNPYGHIGIATGAANATAVEVLEQNGATGNGSGLAGDAIRKRFIAKNRVAGLLRPTIVAPKPAPEHSYAWAIGKRVYLSANVATWRVYKPGTKIVAGTLKPKANGGLSYIIRDIDAPLTNRVIVQSAAFGRVSLPIDSDATIK